MSVFGGEKRAKIPKLKMLIYGKPGVGKTHFAVAAAKVKILHILTEAQGEATVGIVGRIGDLNENTETVMVQSLDEWIAMMPKIRENIHHFHLVVFDTLDDLEEMIGHAIAKAKNGRSIEEVDEYGKSRGTRDAIMQEAVNFLRDLPVHVVALSHLQDRSIEQGRGSEKKITTYTEPRFVGKHAVTVTMQKFNAVGIMEKFRVSGGEKRTIRFRGTALQSLKDLPYLDDVEDANLTAILNKHINYYRPEEPKKGE